MKKRKTENGFYFVFFQGTTTIARCIDDKWTMCGDENIYEYDDFDDIDEVNCVYYC
ncbi:MAG: hypothetical protein GX879_07935 [Bacteroidales bacterium]|nr:hypothetical protein [Bacteroidales bacterium]